MSKFFIAVSAGIAKVYPYGQVSENTKVLKQGEALLCEVPVGPHVEPVAAAATKAPPAGAPQMQPETKELLQGLADEDKAAPAAGVDNDSPPGNRTGTLLVAVLEGTVTVRTYNANQFTEQPLQKGESASVEVTESNRITLAVYEAAPVVDPRS